MSSIAPAEPDQHGWHWGRLIALLVALIVVVVVFGVLLFHFTGGGGSPSSSSNHSTPGAGQPGPTYGPSAGAR